MMSRRHILGAALPLLLALCVFAIHTPPARSAALSWALVRLQSAAGIRADISRLDYNLLTLTFSARNVTLAADGSDAPFFAAEEVRVNLPWSAVRGRIAIESLEIDNPNLTIVRAVDGTLNLPRGAETTTEPLQGPIEIDRFLVRGLRASYDDRSAGMLVDTRGIDINLERPFEGPLNGRLSAHDVSVHTSAQQTRLSRLDGHLAFDGRTLALENVVIEAPEGRLRTDGQLILLPTVALSGLRYQGHLDLARLASWIGADPAPTGLVSFSGTADGPVDGITTTIDAAGNDLRWSNLGSITARTRGAISSSGAAIESLHATVAGGQLEGSARLPFDERSAGSARLMWRSLHVRPIVTTFAPDAAVHVAAVAEGSASFDWNGRSLLTGRGILENTLGATSSTRGVLPVSGHATLKLHDGAWNLSHDHRVGETVELTGQAEGRIDPKAPAASTLNGRAELHVQRLSEVVRLASRAGLADDTDALSNVDGSASVTADLAGTVTAPRAAGAIEIAGIRYGNAGPGTATARYSAIAQRLLIDALQVTIGANIITGRSSIDLDTRAIRGELSGTLPQLALVGADVPAEWRPVGSAIVEARIAGTIDSPSVVADLASDGLHIAGQVVERLRSTLHVSNHLVTIDSLNLAQREGTLEATGTYAISTGRFSAHVKGESLTLSPSDTANLPVEARFDLELTTSGSLESPEAQGFAQFSQLVWEGYDVGPTRIDVETVGRTLQLTGRASELAAMVRARVARAEPRTFTAEASLDAANLANLVRRTGQPESVVLGGAITLHAEATGRLDDVAAATAALDLRLTDATVNGAPVRLVRPARLRYSSDAMVADDLELMVGNTTLAARGRLAPDAAATDALRVSLTGSLADLTPLVRLADRSTFDASGAVDFQMQATGSLKSPHISADLSVTSGSVSSGELPPATEIDVRASYDGGVLDLRDLRATWQGASVTGTGRVPAAVFAARLPEWYVQTLPPTRDPARAILRVGSITPSMLTPFLDEGTLTDVTGRMDGVVALTATSLDVQDIAAEITLERAELSLAKVPLNQARPTRLRLADGRLQVLDWTWAGAGNRINVSGSALLTGASPALDFALDGTLDLRMLSAFSSDVATMGRTAFDVRVTGVADQPLVDGRLSIENGGLVVRDPRFAVTDLQGTVTFARDALELGDIRANANGGTLLVTGNIQYPKFAITGGSIAIRGRGLAVEAPEHLRSEVDADLRLNLSAKTPTLTGNLTVLRGSYREPVSLAAQLLTGVRSRPAVPGSAAEAGVFDRVALDINLKTDEEVVVDNNYARLDMFANLRIVGTIAEPVPTGRMTIGEGGDVFLGGRTYDVVRGTVDFTNATRVEPTIDLALQTRVQRYDITLEVSGTPETLKATLRSPGASQNELVALLLTGQRGDPSAIAQTDIARGQLLMLLSGELLGFAGRAVGLSTVQVGHGLGAAASDFDLLATDTDPSARLTIGKNLSRNVELVFSQALSETGDITWIAIYRPMQNVEVRGVTQDDGSRSYEFRHELSFGGSVPDASSRSMAVERPVERVTAVRIAGTPGLSEAEVLERLRVRVGERFDFYRWQQDRDRLQRLYRDRDFLEARISARRTIADPQSSGTSGVALEYEIDRGPETRLTIEGHSMPGDVVEQMKDAWVSAVFDGFLLDDLTSLTRAQLTRDGYLRADVQAIVVSEPDAAIKEIAVRIEPGARFTGRQIVFSGQQAIPAATLHAAVHAQGLDASVWHDPTVLQAAVEQQYRLLGYLEAAVKVQAPVFTGQSAELPVHINEGRQYTIGGLVINGATARSTEQVVSAFGVTTGSVFQPAVLEPARRAVEREYLGDGYNAVRVTVTTAVDKTRGEVSLTVEVDEGRQQVLAGVEVKGAAITRRAVIDRALDVELGQPADQSEFFRAETRLYDTGAFRTADIAIIPFEPDEGGPVERVRAEVTLQELSPYRFRYGFRVNDTITPIEIDRELRPALVVDFLRRNLFGHAISAGAAGQLESDRRLLRGVVTLPRFFGLPVTTNFFATTSREDFTPEGATPFVEDESGITVEQRFAFSPKMAITYAYDYSRSHIFEPDPIPGIPALELQAKIARLTGTYAWDRRNDPFSPRDGWFHSSGVELGAKALGSDLRFVRYLAQQYYYRSVRNRLVLASALRLGFGRGFDQDLIPSERFYAGGGTSVRGFVEDGLGEVDFFGDPRGGNGMLVFNQEARVALFGWVQAVAFVDAGNVFPKASDFSLTNLEAGTGVGLRINSPFALVRIDFGVPLTSRQRQSTGRWYFGIGQTF